MAVIRDRVDSTGFVKYQATVRKFGETLSHTFKDKETAEIWADWIERMMDEKHAFKNLSPDCMYTVRDVIEKKYLPGSDEYSRCMRVFEPYLDTYINDLSLENLKNFAWEKTLTPKAVRWSSDTVVLPSITTIERTFSYLSSAINHIHGLARKDNVAGDVARWLREKKTAKTD